MANELSSTDVEYIRARFKKWFFDECPGDLNLLITGKTGVGKSRLVNALVGERVAEEGRTKDPCTSEVTSYQANIEGVTVTVWDSPGLQDGTTNEPRYIQDMKRKIKDVSLMIYCIRMDDTRFYEGDKKTIRILTEEFGEKVWENAVVALTFANRVEDPDGEDELEYFQSQLKDWNKKFMEYFKCVGLDHKTSKLIPVIPVGNKKKSMCLPDRANWLSDIWIECYQVMKASARRGMYRINRHRLKPSSAYETSSPANDDIPRHIPLNKQQQKSFLESTAEAFVTGCKGMAEVVSTVVGGVVGGVVGLVAGVVGGALGWLFG